MRGTIKLCPGFVAILSETSATWRLSTALCVRHTRTACSLSELFKGTGSTNQKVSNALDHATSEVRKVAMTRKRADAAKASGESAVLSSPIGRCSVYTMPSVKEVCHLSAGSHVRYMGKLISAVYTTLHQKRDCMMLCNSPE